MAQLDGDDAQVVLEGVPLSARRSHRSGGCGDLLGRTAETSVCEEAVEDRMVAIVIRMRVDEPESMAQEILNPGYILKDIYTD